MRSRLILLLPLLFAAACERHTPQGPRAAAQVPAPPPGEVAISTPATPPDTAGFVREAAAANRFEVAAGQLGQAHAGGADVRRFAGELVKDHDYALGQLQKALAVSGETLSADGAMTPEQSATLAELSRAEPASFDRSFLDAQLKAHQDALTLLQAYAENGPNAAVKAWAGQSLAAIQQHLSEAQRLRERTG